MMDNSAPTQRDSTNREWTVASACMRPLIACLRPSGVSDCERFTVAWTVARMFLVLCSASRASVAIRYYGAKLVNSATEYMGKALVTEGMDR
jgi:hypothetical protein